MLPASAALLLCGRVSFVCRHDMDAAVFLTRRLGRRDRPSLRRPLLPAAINRSHLLGTARGKLRNAADRNDDDDGTAPTSSCCCWWQ
jgi:hypothetical protein